MSKSKIKWTKYSWNPIVGCEKVSPGCQKCYAERMAKRLKAMGNKKYQNNVVDEKGWIGGIAAKLSLEDAVIALPKKSSVIFVGSMSDLFFGNIPSSYIQKVYEMMGLFQKHTFIVCTKRPERIIPVLYKSGYMKKGDYLDNVIHLTSVENQEWAERRIPELRILKEYGDWKIGLSIEPLLSSIKLKMNFLKKDYRYDVEFIDQIIIGGESGPGARPMKPEWARSVRDQCADEGVPFFFKQWGAWVHIPRKKVLELRVLPRKNEMYCAKIKMKEEMIYLKRERIIIMEDGIMAKLSKKQAGISGRLLDGKEYKELAWMN